MRLRKGLLSGIAGLATVATLALTPAAAFAAGPGHGGGGGTRGGGGGGGGGETTATNNLSVPTIFVGANPFGLACPSGPTDPNGTPTTDYPIDSQYYYVQGVNHWQAQCAAASGGSVDVAWGDNLGGEAALVVNHPIRVEVALNDTEATNMTGYTVYKLDPNALDRVSAYGTPATVTTATDGTVISSSPKEKVTVANAGFWVAGAMWKIYDKATGAVVFQGPASAEINATGRVVYGYNLTVTAAKTYVIEFTVPSTSGVTFKSADLGTVTATATAQMATTEITVAGNSGGGGGGGGGGGHGR
jgi:hypothetical protein